ncbi:MAG TPA: hypothetical protein VF701_17845 [Thermoanaerobaculia bacterium]
MTDDRREFQRLRLEKPILATMGDCNALVLDLGVGGAFVEHQGVVIPGHTILLLFRWRGEEIQFVCRIAHSRVIRDSGGAGENRISHSGLDFVEEVDGSAERLRSLITTFVGRVLDAQRANASGEGDVGESVLARLGEARRIRSRGFVTYRLRDKTWWRIPSETPIQPEDGFTVGTFEDEDELENLCRTYETADEEGRRLIRLVAQLSASSARH